MKNTLSILIILLIVGGTSAAVWLNREQTPESGNLLPLRNASGTDSSEKKNPGPETENTNELPADSILVSESISYKNLQLFFLYSRPEITGDRYTTLDEALEAKMVVVKETEAVNELKIDNKSNQCIYINSGDIVRGGKQDRTIQYDVILGPKMRNVDLASFCVEHDRWNSRGDEKDKTFNSSKNSLSSKKLKVAAKMSRDQSEVWAEVGEYQQKTTDNITLNYSSYGSADVKSEVSPSSLELTLENKTIKAINEDYKAAIRNQMKLFENATGMACFINGKLASVDLFNNRELFVKLFDKLLDACIAEAISENISRKNTKITGEDVSTIINKKTRIKSSEHVNKMTLFTVSQSRGNLLQFVTEDRELNQWLHKNWLDKE